MLWELSFQRYNDVHQTYPIQTVYPNRDMAAVLSTAAATVVKGEVDGGSRGLAKQHVHETAVSTGEQPLYSVPECIASYQRRPKEAEETYLRALRGYEEAWGPKHTSTLTSVNTLGALYSDQGKMKEAEEMYLRALRGYEEPWGPKHTSTLGTVNNLGNLYSNHGKMKEAEEMYLRAQRGYEDAWGPKHTSTLSTVSNLGLLYSDQGKMKEAEEMYLRALGGKEEACGRTEAHVDCRHRL